MKLWNAFCPFVQFENIFAPFFVNFLPLTKLITSLKLFFAKIAYTWKNNESNTILRGHSTLLYNKMGKIWTPFPLVCTCFGSPLPLLKRWKLKFNIYPPPPPTPIPSLPLLTKTVNFVILQFISSCKHHRKMFPEPSPKFTKIEMVLIMKDGIFAVTNIGVEFNDPF